ncbi:orotidine-5'-phosphate decarboxylase [Sporosarcina sp. ANT_H38]|uniref:orotidine-5'-phosphate decarboxylase n=1 Tax=Sporosarcina sp. ANT_H38 TaxID=2597358 RepID=UPI0011F3867F|nr:orotidine-5'-phosphate decarboxylase [Sporosarcina sp. ANT_H38]KAA0966229.1 orotidine-5'-phosphate decarboxylase [Sporosarcina sp. ANT_H38]
MKNFADIVIEHSIRKNTALVVGLDPDITFFPDFLLNQNTPTIEEICNAIVEFNKLVIDEVCNHVVAVKPQLAYYEIYGSLGIQALEQTLEYARFKNLLVINDAKRGDIGPTSKAYAKAFLTNGPISGDMVTVNPFLGSDGYNPFIEAAQVNQKGVFLLLKTSNPSSGEVQDLILQNGEILYMHLAKEINAAAVATKGDNNYSFIGAVVGATYPEDAKKVRELLPYSIFLVPGLGVQGGNAEDLAAFFDEKGLGAVISSSRGITYSYFYNEKDEKWRSISKEQMSKSIADSAIKAKKQINEVRFNTNSLKYGLPEKV